SKTFVFSGLTLSAFNIRENERGFRQQASSLAVDPMQQFYTNTNNFNCTGSTLSVMGYRNQTVISLSTKKFIGWGDHDNDRTLDPFDSSP
ncbi:MAG: hypothetical protein WCX22_04360, partial [Methanoregula sp.]